MIRTAKSLAFLAALLPGLVAAQTSLPPNTVLGRISATPGPVQQIPFANLAAQLSSVATHFAAVGTSTGSNAQVIAATSPSGFTLTGNPTVSFVAGLSNTGATTLKVGSSAAFNILKKTPAGLVPLITGDIIAGQQYLATFDGTQYELQEPSQIGNAQITPGAANTVKGSLNGTTTTDLVVASCSAIYQFTQWVTGTGWQCGISPLLPSRATAATLNLSGFSVVTTQGYAAGGDGGGATFKKLSAGVAFTDTYITGASITTGGTGYTNGTYKSVGLGGGTGVGCNGIVVVSGGAVTAFNLTGTLCPGYSVGDVLIPSAANMGGTGSGATITVTVESAPLGSFTDAASNHFQYVVDSGNFPNVRQFGAKLDWDGNDATATNDLLSFKSAIAFAMFPKDSSAALVTGTTIIVPKGTALLCDGTAPFSTLIIPGGVTIRGGSTYSASNLKQCTSENAATNFITLCDPNSLGGVFGCRLIDIGVLADGPANSGVSAVYSNSGQQFPLLENVYIQPTVRRCLTYETGSGGASNAIFDTVDCERSSTTANAGVLFNSSNTIGVFRNWVWGCAPSKCAAGQYAFATGASAGGNAVLENFHIEGHADDISISNTDQVTIRNGTIGNGTGCNGITLQGTSVAGHTLIENIQSTCNPTVLNGHAGGTNITGSIVLQVAP